MKKVLLLTLLVFTCTAAFAEGGLGLKFGTGANDAKHKQGAIEKSDVYGGLEFFIEGKILSEDTRLGLKGEVLFFGENKFKGPYGYLGATTTYTESTVAFPITVYYKAVPGAFSWYAGYGFTILNTSLSGGAGYSSQDMSEIKLFLHAAFGAEYRFGQVFALGVDMRYNFSAQVKGEVFGGQRVVYSDRSGLGGAVTARFYFGGE